MFSLYLLSLSLEALAQRVDVEFADGGVLEACARGGEHRAARAQHRVRLARGDALLLTGAVPVSEECADRVSVFPQRSRGVLSAHRVSIGEALGQATCSERLTRLSSAARLAVRQGAQAGAVSHRAAGGTVADGAGAGLRSAGSRACQAFCMRVPRASWKESRHVGSQGRLFRVHRRIARARSMPCARRAVP